MPQIQSAPITYRSGRDTLLVIFMLATAVLGWQLAQMNRPIAADVTSPVACAVYFSPDGGCTQAIVDTLDAARQRVLVQAYSFTSRPIAEALLRAKQRGVSVQVILDKSQRTEHYSEADFFAHMGIPTYIDAVHSIAHNKVMIIDQDTVITGSFNFTRAAEEHNAENLLILHNAALAEKYAANWNNHLSHSEAYAGR